MRHQAIRRRYDAMAGVYDSLYAAEQTIKHAALLEATDPKRSDIVLETGCGTGLLLKRLRRRVSHTVGIDLSEKMIRKAFRRIRQYPEISLVAADASLLPCRSSCFDIIFSVTVLQNIIRPRQALEEWVRLLKPRGILGFSAPRKAENTARLAHLLPQEAMHIAVVESEQSKDMIIVVRKASAPQPRKK